MSLKFLTWNILGNCKKNKKFYYIEKNKVDICLLHETHLSNTNNSNITTPNYAHIFLSHYNTRQRGVSVLLHEKLSFNLNTTIADTEGRGG
uniref:Endonuclease/exonuclease/phosphatase domain-containing protein n=1 Tax=Amphiprion percula TaxID=161767 RepID=A0A3P8S3T5_AMPPE